MNVRNVKKEDKDGVTKILLQMQELHRKNREDIFRKVTKKDIEEEFKGLLENNEKIIVAVDEEDKVRGLAQVSIREIKNRVNMKECKIMYIQKIGVDDKFRRKGIGKLLIEEVKKEAKKFGCSRIELSCWSFNIDAIKFYEECGMSVQRLNMEMKI